MIIKHAIVVFLAFQQIVMYEQNVKMLWIAVFILEGGLITTPRTLWINLPTIRC